MAADALAPGGRLSGQAYFITNDEPRPFWGMMGDVCEGLGYKRPSIHLPLLLARPRPLARPPSTACAAHAPHARAHFCGCRRLPRPARRRLQMPTSKLHLTHNPSKHSQNPRKRPKPAQNNTHNDNRRR